MAWRASFLGDRFGIYHSSHDWCVCVADDDRFKEFENSVEGEKKNGEGV